MDPEAVHRSLLRTSEAVDLSIVALSVLLTLLAPLPWPALLGWPARLALGTPCLAAGVLLIVWSKRALAAHEQRAEPGFATTRIVSDGIFSRTRNPIYLASFPLYAAAGFYFGTLWPIVLVPAAALAFRVWLIGPEERYLRARFPEEYGRYEGRVGRWWTFG